MTAPQAQDHTDFGLWRLRRIALAAFALQLVAMVDWSHVIWSRFSLTDDFAVYWQAWWKISHGHFNPFDTLANYPFWQDHCVLLIWPIAFLTHFGLGGFAPLALQDLSIVAAEMVAFFWVLRLIREAPSKLPMRGWLLGAISLAALIINPWIYWAISFDVHLDTSLAAPFLVLSLRALYYRRYRQLALWALLTVLCGDVAATYVVGVGAAGLLASISPAQRRVRASAALIVAGVIAFGVITHLGGSNGSALIVRGAAGIPAKAGASTGHSETSNLIHLALHPGNLLFAPFHQARNVWALISPAGMLGLLSPWGLPIVGLIAMENTASGAQFSAVAFQYIPVWAPLVVAVVFAARGLSQGPWRRRAVSTVLVVSLLNTIGWAVVWLPRVNYQWVKVDSGAAHVLDEARAMIPADAEVIASQGIVGGFADRDEVDSFPNHAFYEPVLRPVVYFVILPYQGIELAPVNQSLGLIGALAGPRHATLVLHGYDVWVFRWTPPPSMLGHTINIAASYDDTFVPVWGARSAVGRPVFNGPSRDWTMTTVSRRGGYVLDGAYFLKPPGDYALRVRLSTSGTANVEVWNAAGNLLLGRRILPETNGRETVDVPVDNRRNYPIPVYDGHFLFKDNPILPPAGNLVEARIYVPPSTTCTVYSVQLVPVSS